MSGFFPGKSKKGPEPAYPKAPATPTAPPYPVQQGPPMAPMGAPPPYTPAPPQGHMTYPQHPYYPAQAVPQAYPAQGQPPHGYPPHTNPAAYPAQSSPARNPGYPVNPAMQGTSYTHSAPGMQPYPGAIVVPGMYDAGARFDTVAQPNIPPPPPGCAPNAAQVAAMQGHTVVGTQRQGNWFIDGAGGGSSFF